MSGNYIVEYVRPSFVNVEKGETSEFTTVPEVSADNAKEVGSGENEKIGVDGVKHHCKNYLCCQNTLIGSRKHHLFY